MVPAALTEAEWSPFGWLPVADVDPRDGKETLTFEWADAHVNLIGHVRAEVPETASGLRCEMLFRHDTHTQALMPLNVPAVIVVAPADVEFADQRARRTGHHPRLPDRAPGVPGAAPGHLALGPVPARGTRGPALQRPGAPLCRGQPLRGPGRQGPRRRDRARRTVRRPRRPAEPLVALDDAEEAEVVPATVAELVDAITARDAGPDAQGRPTFTTTSPKWWVHGRVFGGMVVAQALNAAMRTVPARLEVHSLHGCFLRPTSPGSQTTHVGGQRPRRKVVQHPAGDERGGGQGDLPHDVLVPPAREGDKYQLPIAPTYLRRRRWRVRGALPVRHPRARGDDPATDGTYESTRESGPHPSRCRTTRPCTRASWPTSRT